MFERTTVKIMNQNQNMEQNDNSMEIDFGKIVSLLLRRAWIIVLCTILAASIAWGVTIQFVTPQYRSQTQMYVSQGINAAEIAAAQALVETCSIYLKSSGVLETVLEEAKDDLENVVTVGQLRGMIGVSAVNETEIFNVTVTGPNRYDTVVLANAIATVLPGMVSNNLNRDFSVKVIDDANGTDYRCSPNVPQNITVGALIGFLLSALCIVMASLFDPYIKTEEDVSKVYGIPLLAVIPFAGAQGKKGSHYSKYGYSKRNADNK